MKTNTEKTKERAKLRKRILDLEAEAARLGLVTMSDAAKLKGVSRSAILQLIQRDRLDTVVILGHKMVFRDDVTGFVNMPPGRSVGSISMRHDK